MNNKKIKQLDQVPGTKSQNRISDLITKLQDKISKQRLFMRSTISNRPVNIVTVLSLLPFFVGFFDFLNQNQQLKKTLFKKNLPGLDIPTESVNWDTFEYFKKNNKDFLLGIENVDWSNDSLFLTKNPKKEVKDPQVFIASFKNSRNVSPVSVETSHKLSPDNISDWEIFTFNYLNKNPNQAFPFQKAPLFRISTTHFCDVLETFYLNLDEIPLKLEKNFFFIETSNVLQSKKPISNKDSLINEINTDQEIIEVDQDKSTTQPTKLSLKPQFWKNKKFKNQNSFDFVQSQKQLSHSSLTKEQKVFFDLMKNPLDFDKIKSFSAFNQPHFTTVLNFSDIKTSSYDEYSLKKALNKLKISGTEFFSEKGIKGLVDTNILLSDLQELKGDVDEVFLDQRFSNRQMSGYLYPDMNSKQVTRFLLHNFFSCFPKNFSFDNTNQKLLKINLPANPNFLSFSNPKVLGIKPEIGLFSFHQSDTTVSVSKDLPIFFKFKNAVDFTSKLDYFYSPQFLTPQIKQSSALSGEFFNDTSLVFNAVKKESPVTYQKIISLFDKPEIFQKSFSQSWEGFSFHSWLIISQLGFAFLVFQFLKSLLTEYFNELLWFLLDFLVHASIIDENLKEEINILTGKSDKGFRIIPKITKKFKDVAGIKPLLPEIAEIVWFLRNSGKEFSLSKNFPRGVLLIGPPGTGKTFLVQAIAGEAEVPILTLSGSSLVAPGESGALKLELLFREARQIAPCIVFIDEIDTLAQKRQGVMQNPMGGDEILSVLEPTNVSLELGQSDSQNFLQTKRSNISFFNKTDQIANLAIPSTKFSDSLNLNSSQKIALEIKQQMHAQEKYQKEQLTLLMQLLIELDGIQGRKGVIVIGATNRPEVLDSALVRPGRFDKIIELGLPNHEKRLEIFKLYGQILGYEKNISWEYLARRTVGFTAADLASIMNQSSLKAILDSTEEIKPYHSLHTIEHGIDRITTYEIDKPTTKVVNFYVKRMAYYEAGKVLLSTILEFHPPTIVSYLWPRRQNRRSFQILTNLQNYFFQFARRCELEDRIIGCYGGKAAEILFLENSSVNVSTFGLEDLNFAFVLICFVIEKWYLYSKSTLVSQLTQILATKNSQEFIPEKIELFKELAYSMEFSPDLFYSHEADVPTHPLSQNFFSSAWWQLHISQELEFVERTFSDWYRLYLPNPEETERNIEWSPPDEFYHRNLAKKSLNTETSVMWNDLYKITRDYQVQALVAQSFNKALVLLDENREFLDKLVFELLQKEVLRESEIEKVACIFKSLSNKPTEKLTDTTHLNIKIVNNSFGPFSRRKMKNWIDFKYFSNE